MKRERCECDVAKVIFWKLQSAVRERRRLDQFAVG